MALLTHADTLQKGPVQHADEHVHVPPEHVPNGPQSTMGTHVSVSSSSAEQAASVHSHVPLAHTELGPHDFGMQPSPAGVGAEHGSLHAHAPPVEQ